MNFQIKISFACVVLFTTVIGYSTAFVSNPSRHDPWKPVPIPPRDPKENAQQYWHNQALGTLNEKLARELNKNKAKNIIFFLGDGMSGATITAARIYQGQLHNKTGEENKLSFEKFPYTGLSKTYCVDKQVADSASTATAYMCGVKTNFQTIGVTAAVNVADCESTKKNANRVTSIVKWAHEADKATGVVTTARVTHASPAGSYAQVPHRGMESDTDVIKIGLNPKLCDFDIAKQLVRGEPGHDIRVILGGGRSKFLTEAGSLYGKGDRMDVNLVEEWLADKKGKNAKAQYVSNVNELKNVDPSEADYVLGLFSDQHLHYHLENMTSEPTLTEMTEMAIKILQKEKNGFYLFVEGGLIDKAHHGAMAHLALDETIEFSNAIQKAVDMTDEKDTLIVVTSDHAHTMTMNGYAYRGYDILGIFGKSNDSLPYTTLSYANGPGYHPEGANHTRYNLEHDQLYAWNYTFPSMIPRNSETHGGDDVAVFARGPWAHLFSGNYEQNYLPLAEAYAAQIGPAKTNNAGQSFAPLMDTSSSSLSILFISLFCMHGSKYIV